ncbi:MAG: hypothetical protein ACI3ZL_07135 [Candidatus Cryptobacteroides sp.]
MERNTCLSVMGGYETPSVLVTDILPEGVLCSSGDDFTGSVGIDDFIQDSGDDSFLEF